MNDDASPASGNRWEPADQPAHASVPEPGPPGWSPWPLPAAPPAARLADRARAVVAGGAAAVLLAGGFGGFAVGRATAGGSDDRRRPAGRAEPASTGTATAVTVGPGGPGCWSSP